MYCIGTQENKTSADLIKDFINSDKYVKDIDYMFVGNRGADFGNKNDKKYMGKVATQIIRNTKLNCMFMKIK